jgi:hypothetical protein
MLCWFANCFQLCNVVWLSILLAGSGDEFCGLLSVLFPAAAYQPPHQPFCFSSLCLLKVHLEIISLPLPPSLMCSESSTHSAACPFLFLVYYSVFFFLQGQIQSAQGPMLVYPRGNCENTMCCLFAHLLVCISHAGLEPVSGSLGALLFSQCSMAWRSCVQVGGSGCQSFDSSWCFFSAKCGSSVSASFFFFAFTKL